MALVTRNSYRYVSIDLLRGAALVAMLLVSSRSPLPQLRHGTWYRVTLADLVYPCFLLLIGMSMAISVARVRPDSVSLSAYYYRLARRIVWLFVIGLALTVVGSGRMGSGTLQSIAIASLLTLPIALSRWQMTLGYLVICIAMQLLAYTTISDPGMIWSATGNAAEKLDLAILGKFRGVEGVLGSLFSGLFIILGLVVGAMLPLPAKQRLKYSVALAAMLATIGIGFESALALPIVPRLISPSFFFLAGSLLTAVTSVTIWLFDRNTLIAPLRPIARIGENPLAIFCGVKLFQDFVLRISVGTPPHQLAEVIRESVRSSVNESLGLAAIPLIKVCLAFLIAEFLAKKRLRLRL